MRKINIAVDGHSSCGKSTLARDLAKKLGYTYIDSGSMYRAVTYHALERGWIDSDEIDDSSLIHDLSSLRIEFKWISNQQHLFLNDQDIERFIRDQKVAEHVSRIARIEKVRDFLVKIQQEMGVNKGVVMDGRDIGTVVFPDAELKLFVTADPEVRAERRFLEMRENGNFEITKERILENLLDRDRLDSNRKVGPLVKAKDAILLDTTHHTRDSQLQEALKLAYKTLKKS